MFRPIYRPIYRAIASALAQSLPGGFNPASLFADGSKGVVYDNNDLSSFYLDSAGTTAATVNGLVGLQLDKSQGLVLGAERFADQPSAIDNSSGAATIVHTAATRTVQVTVAGSNNAYPRLQVSMGLSAAKRYVVSGRIDGARTNVSSIRLATSGTANNLAYDSSTGVFSGIQEAGATPLLEVLVNGTLTGTVTIATVSVQELPGNHRYQTTTGSKPVLRGTPTGSNLVTNGDFASGTGWTAGAGWAIGSGVATATTSSGTLTSTLAATASKNYRVTYTITRSAGSVQVSFGGRTGASRSAAGTYVDYLDSTTNTNALVFTGTTFSGTVDNVEVVDVSAGQVTAPYGLQYDLVDDVLLTASIDFSATDSVYASFGVHKFGDSAAQCFMELTASSAANPGFAIFAPQAAAANYEFRSRGTLAASAVATTYTAPIRNVVSGSADISTDTCILRVNGAQVATSASDQGTGNYSNAVLYFGRRGGSTNPFGGLDFGGVLVGKTLTDNQMASVDRYVNQRTGAY